MMENAIRRIRQGIAASPFVGYNQHTVISAAIRIPLTTTDHDSFTCQENCAPSTFSAPVTPKAHRKVPSDRNRVTNAPAKVAEAALSTNKDAIVWRNQVELTADLQYRALRWHNYIVSLTRFCKLLSDEIAKLENPVIELECSISLPRELNDQFKQEQQRISILRAQTLNYAEKRKKELTIVLDKATRTLRDSRDAFFAFIKKSNVSFKELVPASMVPDDHYLVPPEKATKPFNPQQKYHSTMGKKEKFQRKKARKAKMRANEFFTREFAYYSEADEETEELLSSIEAKIQADEEEWEDYMTDLRLQEVHDEIDDEKRLLELYADELKPYDYWQELYERYGYEEYYHSACKCKNCCGNCHCKH